MRLQEKAVLNFGVGSPEFVAGMIETHGHQNPNLKGYMPHALKWNGCRIRF